MTIDEIAQIIEPYIDQPMVNFEIQRQIFNDINGKKIFNKIIRTKVDEKFGVYVWVDSIKKDIVYIGMAGKIKVDGNLASHTIQNRLTASRDKDDETGKYIQTNEYVKKFMDIQNIEQLSFYIMYSKEGEPPAYLEALLLYKYYKKNKKLPILNNSF